MIGLCEKLSPLPMFFFLIFSIVSLSFKWLSHLLTPQSLFCCCYCYLFFFSPFGDWHENVKPLLVILYQTPLPSGSLPKWPQEFPPPSDCHWVPKSTRGFRSHLFSGEFSSVWCAKARRPGLFRMRLWDKCFQVGTMELVGGEDAGEWRRKGPLAVVSAIPMF